MSVSTSVLKLSPQQSDLSGGISPVLRGFPFQRTDSCAVIWNITYVHLRWPEEVTIVVVAEYS
jgi:hypothetical protein